MKGANIITSTKVYALYAQPTFIDRKLYLTNIDFRLGHGYNYRQENHTRDVEALIRKYDSRGWSFAQIDAHKQHDPSTQGPFRHIRMLADSHSWIMKLPSDGIEQAKTPESVFDASSWGFVIAEERFAPRAGIKTRTYAEVQAIDYIHPALKYTHTFPSAPGRSEWAKAASSRLDAVLALQMDQLKPQYLREMMRVFCLMPENKRVTWRAMRRANNRTKPEERTKDEFDYHDDELVELFKEWMVKMNREEENFGRSGRWTWLPSSQ
ncbi:hypothetical protein MMC10_003649 [Thelotrema lepadinum]|nr:hypothetical protein [Thelotrema lepadinum]